MHWFHLQRKHLIEQKNNIYVGGIPYQQKSSMN